MPVHVKLIISALVVAVGTGFFFYEQSIGQDHVGHVGFALAAMMILAMWIFPEAQRKKN